MNNTGEELLLEIRAMEEESRKNLMEAQALNKSHSGHRRVVGVLWVLTKSRSCRECHRIRGW